MRNESKFKARPQHQCESSLDQRHTPALHNFLSKGNYFYNQHRRPKNVIFGHRYYKLISISVVITISHVHSQELKKDLEFYQNARKFKER